MHLEKNKKIKIQNDCAILCGTIFKESQGIWDSPVGSILKESLGVL